MFSSRILENAKMQVEQITSFEWVFQHYSWNGSGNITLISEHFTKRIKDEIYYLTYYYDTETFKFGLLHREIEDGEVKVTSMEELPFEGETKEQIEKIWKTSMLSVKGYAIINAEEKN